MTELAVRAVMTADAKGLVGAANDASASMDKLRGAVTNAEVPSRRLEGAISRIGIAAAGASPQLGAIAGDVRAFVAVAESIGPVGLAITAAGAALGYLITKSIGYDTAVTNLDLAARAHGSTIAANREGYIALTNSLANIAGVSMTQAANFAAMGVASDASEASMRRAAAVVRDYAQATGKDLNGAWKDLAAGMRDPAAFVEKLNQEFHWLSAAEAEQVHQLTMAGQAGSAFDIVISRIAAHTKDAKDETSGWLGLFERLLGYWAVAESGIQIEKKPVSPLPNAPMFGSDQRNKLSLEWKSVADSVDQYQSRLDKLKETEQALISLHAQGYGTQMQFERALAMIQRERISVLQQQKTDLGGDALKLVTEMKDEAAAAGYALDQLLDKGAEAIESAGHQADAAERQSQLDERNVAGRQKLVDALQTETALLPYTIALRGAEGEKAQQLQDAIDRLTAGYERLHTAQAAMAADARNRSAISDIDSHVVSLGDIEAQLGRSGEAYNAQIAIITKWRDDTLANLDQTKEGWQQYADAVQRVFQDELSKAYEDDLRRRTDWAAGVERANIDIARSHQDMASKSEQFLKGFDRTGEDIFAQFARTGKLSVKSMVDYVIDQFARMAYQKYLSQSVNSLGNSLLDFASGQLGLGGGGGFGGGFGGGTFGSDFGGGDLGGLMSLAHTGGMLGVDGLASRYVHPAHFDGAPRYHRGGLLPGEMPIVAKRGEGVFTPKQMDTAGDVLIAALQRPVIVELPPNAGANNSAPKITVNVHNPNGTSAKVDQKQSPNGDITLDVMVEMIEAKMAGRINSGQSSVGDVIQNVFDLRRTPR